MLALINQEASPRPQASQTVPLNPGNSPSQPTEAKNDAQLFTQKNPRMVQLISPNVSMRTNERFHF